MVLYDLIPTCDNLMSIYTLITFVIYAIILICVGQFILKRFETGGIMIKKLQDDINLMKIDLATIKTSIADMEADARETRVALAAINRILIDKLK